METPKPFYPGGARGRPPADVNAVAELVVALSRFAVRAGDRIASIERVADDLFDEWRAELKQYSSATLRASSEQKMNDTRIRYERMLASMKNARQRIDPVLHVFQDHVLFLKHNLNARALASLQNEVTSIEGKVDMLIRDMEAAIAEADSFIRAMQ